MESVINPFLEYITPLSVTIALVIIFVCVLIYYSYDAFTSPKKTKKKKKVDLSDDEYENEVDELIESIKEKQGK